MSRSATSSTTVSSTESSLKINKTNQKINTPAAEEELERLRRDYDAALKRISRLERELVEYEIDLPPLNEENRDDDDENSAELSLQMQNVIAAAADVHPNGEAVIPKRKRNWISKYFLKWKGEKFFGSAKLQPWLFIVFSFIGSFIGIGVLFVIHQYWLIPQYHIAGIIPSFGASAVLLFGTESPLAQPRAVIGGHVIAAFVGTTLYVLMQSTGLNWLIGALAVAFSIVLMQVTKTIHPPAGATALIAVLGSAEIKDSGFLYIVVPTFSGAIILVLVSILVMNLKFRYPKFWL
jgi:hypothetical protein